MRDLSEIIDILNDAAGCPPNDEGNCAKHEDCRDCWREWLEGK